MPAMSTVAVVYNILDIIRVSMTSGMHHLNKLHWNFIRRRLFTRRFKRDREGWAAQWLRYIFPEEVFFCSETKRLKSHVVGKYHRLVLHHLVLSGRFRNSVLGVCSLLLRMPPSTEASEGESFVFPECWEDLRLVSQAQFELSCRSVQEICVLMQFLKEKPHSRVPVIAYAAICQSRMSPIDTAEEEWDAQQAEGG